MSKQVDFLLIGGGIASATAAETLRVEGAEGKIAVISAENYPPYHRPPLSKDFLLEEFEKKKLLVNERRFYEENDIDLILRTKATAVNSERKIVETEGAGSFQYGKLLIATGCSIVKLSAPGSEKSGIYYLRNIDDAEALKSGMKKAKKAVVVGSSFIGMEVASVLAQREIKVTIVAQENLLFDRLQSPEISKFFTEYYRRHGVELVFEEKVKEFKGGKRVNSVVTSGGKELECDLVAVGVGVTPSVDFLEGSGILIDNGIVVDEHMRTNKEDIFGAGDVANFFDPVFGRHRRIEHWDNAMKHGRYAARNMLGKMESCRAVSYFFSDVFDLSFNFLGDVREEDERIVRGSPEDKSFSVLYIRDGRLAGTFLLGRPTSEDKAAGSLIMNRVNLGDVKEKLAKTQFPLHKIPNQIVLVLQGGGALGAFQCGVVEAMEDKGVHPDIVAGVSIGAFNGAIIAGNPRDATPALRAFWEELSQKTPGAPNEQSRRALSSFYTLLFGASRFFKPRWFKPGIGLKKLPQNWTSFYDHSPVKEILAKYVDFDNLKKSPVRLLVSAVNVETSELRTFDSYVDDLTVDHILASGSLPPGFPWTTIDGNHYWDGGIVSNTPLDQVIELCGITGKDVYVVNLFPRENHLPRNMMEVIERRDEIFYAEKIRREIRMREIIGNHRELIEEIMKKLDPQDAEQIAQRPLFIETMGEYAPVSVKRIVHQGEEDEPPSKDYDFSRKSILFHIEEGYKAAKKVLEEDSKNS